MKPRIDNHDTQKSARLIHRIPAIMLVILGTFALQNYLIWFTPLDRLITTSVVDDAFYYLTIARHVIAGHGPSFDGIHQTNGFQPLWQLLVLPLGWISSKDLALRCLCLLGAVCYQITTFLLYRMAQKLWNDRTALITALCWGCNARLLLYYALDGMEFSLYAMTVSLLVLGIIALNTSQEEASSARSFSLGLLGGICTLSRVDGVIFAAMGAMTILIFRRRMDRPKSLLRFLFFFCAGVLLLTLPYIGWNWSHFNHLLPVSGLIKRHAMISECRAAGIEPWGMAHCGYLLKTGIFFIIKYIIRFSTGYGYYLARKLHVGQVAISLLSLVLLGVLLAKGLIRSGWLRGRARVGKLAFFYLFVLMHFAIYAILLTPFLDYGNWYFGPFYMACCLFTASLIEPLIVRGWSKAGILALGLMLLNCFAVLMPNDELKINILGSRACLQYINKYHPNDRIGAWNAGFLGYFSEGNNIINLDGLVGDYELADYHIQNKSIVNYLNKNGIQYLCDYTTTPIESLKSFYGLSPSQFEVEFKKEYHARSYLAEDVYCYILKLNHNKN